MIPILAVPCGNGKSPQERGITDTKIRPPEEIARQVHRIQMGTDSPHCEVCARKGAEIAQQECAQEIERLTRERDSAKKSRDEFESACFNLRQDHETEVERLKGKLAEAQRKYDRSILNCSDLLLAAGQEGINEGLEMAAKYVTGTDDSEWLAEHFRSLKVKP